jgi:GNAT superfamily N-acetyltransferase
MKRPRCDLELSLTDDPTPEDVQFLDDRLYEFNVASTGIGDARLLAVFSRDGAGQIIGGLHGWTWGRCCEIRHFWVHELWRGRRLGTRLLELAEREARARGARMIVLATHSFQAPAFYRRRGFSKVGSVSDFPAGHEQIYLRKRLKPP